MAKDEETGEAKPASEKKAAAPKKGALLSPAVSPLALVRTASAIERVQPLVAHRAAARHIQGVRRAFFARWDGGGAAAR